MDDCHLWHDDLFWYAAEEWRQLDVPLLEASCTAEQNNLVVKGWRRKFRGLRRQQFFGFACEMLQMPRTMAPDAVVWLKRPKP